MVKRIYLGGGMLDLGDQMRRNWEKQEIERLGFEVYAPQDDKSINDKQNATQEGLAERIVDNDILGMQISDILIFDYLPHNQGTIAEMGFAQCMIRSSQRLSSPVNVAPTVYVQCTDIRQGTGHVPSEQDRTEFSINQYVYGVILELTNGKGIQTWDQITADLIKKHGDY